MRVLGIAGSLRAESHNARLLRAAAAELPPGWELERWEGLRDVPAYDEDLDVEPGPAAVGELREAIAGGDAQERADAARNRRKILEAAQALFAERGVDQVSMDDVARAAQVGKGTLYRRFGDRASLAFALLDERERALQEWIIRGEPPLGPGAEA